MKNKLAFLIILLLLSGKILTAKMLNLANDTTSIFTVTSIKKDKLLSFDDNNTLVIKSQGIKMICKEAPGDNYNLSVSIKNKLILSKKGIKGITKVLCENGYLMFSIFTYTDEDGNNEGYGYVININNGLVKIYPQKLKNTCNPVILNNVVYLLSDGYLIKTNMEMHLSNTISISYKSKPVSFLDSYMISGIIPVSKSLLMIEFMPDKSIEGRKSYSGIVGDFTKMINIIP